EISPGKYVSSYQVQPTDFALNLPVVARLTLPYGFVQTAATPPLVCFNQPAVANGVIVAGQTFPPRVMPGGRIVGLESPRGTVLSAFTVTGWAPAGARVHLQILAGGATVLDARQDVLPTGRFSIPVSLAGYLPGTRYTI